MELPSELLSCILEKLFYGTIITGNFAQCTQTYCTSGSQVPINSRAALMFPILATCQKMRQSAIPVLMSECTLRLKLSSCGHRIQLPFEEVLHDIQPSAFYWFSVTKLTLMTEIYSFNLPWRKFKDLKLLRVEFTDLIRVPRIDALPAEIDRWLDDPNLEPLLRRLSSLCMPTSSQRYFQDLWRYKELLNWNRGHQTRLQIRERIKVRVVDPHRVSVAVWLDFDCDSCLWNTESELKEARQVLKELLVV